MHQYHVYIMASRSKVLYVGVTRDLRKRVEQHRTKQGRAFTSKDAIDRLVYFEETDDINAAIAGEKQIKGWLRTKKVALIEAVNPGWVDLSESWFDIGGSAPAGVDSSLRSE
jgi:putative endonuclease